MPSDTVERQSTPHLVHLGKDNDHVDILVTSSSYFLLQPKQVSLTILHVTFNSHEKKNFKAVLVQIPKESEGSQ